MRDSLLFSFFLSLAFLLLCSWSIEGQEVLHQLGDRETESWDAVSKEKGQEQVLFALGYQRETLVADQRFVAPDRGVVLGKMTTSSVEVLAHLYSRGGTRVHGICRSPQGLYVFGNAFSFLVYNADTLFPTNGRNTAFILHLDTAGQLQNVRHFNSQGAVLGQAALWQAEANQFLSLLQIRDTFFLEGQEWVPRAATASLLLHWSPDLELQAGTLIDGIGEIEASHLKSIEDEIYVAGRFKGRIETATDSIFTPTADFDGFILSLQTQGQERFIRHLRGQFDDDIFTIEASEEAIYLGGQFIGNLRLQNLEILTGQQVAGFLGAMRRSGEALWLHPVRGSSISTAVSAVYPQAEELLYAVWTGETTIFQGDTLQQPTMPGQVHSILGRTDLSGQAREWNLWPGDNLIYITDFIPLQEDLVMTAEMMGRFAGARSRGFFDALLLDPNGTSSLPTTSDFTSDLKLYPQPARHKLCISPFSQPYNYQIFTAAGQFIESGRLSSPCLPIDQLTSGAYVLCLQIPETDRPQCILWIKG